MTHLVRIVTAVVFASFVSGCGPEVDYSASVPRDQLISALKDDEGFVAWGRPHAPGETQSGQYHWYQEPLVIVSYLNGPIITFRLMGNGFQPGAWLAIQNGESQRYTDSKICPRFVRTLGQLESMLHTPVLPIHDFIFRPHPRQSSDSYQSVTLAGADSRGYRSHATIQVTGEEGGLRQWREAFDRATASCWRAADRSATGWDAHVVIARISRAYRFQFST